MTYKRSYVMVVIGAALGVLVFTWFAWCYTLLWMQEKQSQESKGVQAHAQQDGIVLHVVTRREETPYAVATVAYPSFPAYPELSEAIAQSVRQHVAAHFASSEENWRARAGTDEAAPDISVPTSEMRYDLTIQWFPGDITEHVISIGMTGSAYTGGAHGTEWTETYTYSGTQKRMMTIADAIGQNHMTMENLMHEARNALREEIMQRTGTALTDTERATLEEGTDLREENYRAFTIANGRVTVYFQQYQIAAYALGSFTFTLYPVSN